MQLTSRTSQQAQTLGKHSKPGKVRTLIVSALVLSWLLLSGYALFDLQTSQLRLFDESVLTSAEPFPVDQLTRQYLAASGVPDHAVMFHAWDPGCACSEASLLHLARLASELAAHGVEVAVVTPALIDEGQRARFVRTTGVQPVAWFVDAGKSYLPASPAAIVVAANGQPVYVGPYAAGAACVSGSGGFVESAIRAVDKTPADVFVNRTVSGCYCAWQTDRSTPTVQTI